MEKWIAGVGAAAAFTAFSVWNYRRFMPRPRPLCRPGNEIEIRPLTVQAGEHKLYGELLLPKGANMPVPTVICCHGFGSSYKLCRDTMGKCLAMSGFGVYCFDFYGGSKHTRSGGSMLEMSIFTERGDLDAVIDHIRTLDCVDRDNLFLLGESQGGCVAGITAPRHRNELKAMVLYYPAFCIPDDARKKFARVEDIPAVSRTFGLDVGKIYHEKLLDYDVYADIRGYDGPVLIVHGDKDNVVDISYGRKAAGTYANARFEVLPDEGHGFTGKGKLKAAQLAYEFLTEQMSCTETAPPEVSPFLPGCEYVADGEPHVFGDRLYIVGSHDRFGGKKFCENDYVGWSAPLSDLSRWRYEGVTYRREQDPDNRNGKLELWAPDLVQGPDGRYYLYYCLANHPKIGVAVCSTPAGRYEFLGWVKHPDGTALGQKDGDVWPFDPAVLADDDGRIHLYTGQSPLTEKMAKIKTKTHTFVRHMELEPDMLTLKTEPVPLIPSIMDSAGTGFEGHEFFEAASIRKFDGRYYCIYSSVLSHELCWAVSEKPDSGFRFGGTLVSNGDIGLEGMVRTGYNAKADPGVKNYIGNNHGSVEKINGRYYVFYHRHTNRNMYSRQACAAPIEMDEAGRFAQAEMVSSGLGGPLPGCGHYEARIACRLRSEKGCVFSAHPMVQNQDHPAFTQDESDGWKGRQYIANLRSGACAAFKYFDMDGADRITAVLRGTGSGTLTVSTEENGTPLAAIPVHQAAEWTEFSAPMQAVHGTAALYFVYSGTGAVDFLSFNMEKTSAQAE